MVSAGESSGAGALEVVFERLSRQLEEGAELRSQLTGALVYPAVMAVVAAVGVGVLVGFVIPRFAAALADIRATLPLSTRLLLETSRIVTKGWWAWLLLITGAAYWWSSALRRPETRRRWHHLRLRLPWVGDLESKYSTARFTRTLGLLLQSGVPAIRALRIARSSVVNLILQEGVDRATQSVTEGGGLAAGLDGVLPPLALQMLAVGEEGGKLDDMCVRIADTYDGEVRRALRTGVTLLEPLLILGFGALVGFIALAMLQAIYGINLRTL
jgi:type II secretory pathway component PulF